MFVRRYFPLRWRRSTKATIAFAKIEALVRPITIPSVR
jgi:hypothetical protein